MKPTITLIFTLFFIFQLSCQQNKNTDELVNNREPHRPYFHFSPDSMWMNDPNGMVYYEGEYHLFYQHYPEKTVWGPMHWGHAVSEDLIHWEDLPIALYPDSLGYIFSGSALIDWENTSGFGVDGQPPMIAIFTYHDPVGEKSGSNTFQYQGIAYSNDKGRTWTKYAGNPVVPNPGIRDFRDPKVIWDKDSEQWVMVFAAWDHVKLYGSKDLKEWTYLSDFGREWGSHAGVWECPDLFPITVEETGEQKWVLLLSINPGSYNGGSGTQYFVGDFDGKSFNIDQTFSQNLGIVSAFVPTGEVFEDFENGYGEWQTEGDAFGTQPAQGALEGQQEVEGYSGKFLVNSFLNGDQTTGKLISPTFTVQKPFINFQVGGGNDKLRTAVSLIADGKQVRSSSGGNGERLRWTSWDVSDLIGQSVHIEIHDNHTGGWGHINVDHIMFSDAQATPEREKAVWLDYGRDNYAGVTWSDIPESDGRRIFLGWMSNWDYAQVVPTEKWRSAMTFPRELTLTQTSQGFQLASQAVEELEGLRKETQEIQLPGPGEFLLDLSSEKPLNKPLIAEAELSFTIEEGTTPTISLQLSNNLEESYEIGFNSSKNEFFSDRTNAGEIDFSTVFAEKNHTAPRQSQAKVITMHLLIDVASAELFADDGLTAITDIFFPTEDFTQLHLSVKGEGINLENGVLNWLE